MISLGIHFQFKTNQSNCTNTPDPIPIWQGGDGGFVIQPGNFSLYDKLARFTAVTLLSFFTNGSLYTGSPFATTQMLCTNPKEVTPGSHVPTNAAELLSHVSMATLIGIGLALNALAFLAL